MLNIGGDIEIVRLLDDPPTTLIQRSCSMIVRIEDGDAQRYKTLAVKDRYGMFTPEIHPIIGIEEFTSRLNAIHSK